MPKELFEIMLDFLKQWLLFTPTPDLGIMMKLKKFKSTINSWKIRNCGYVILYFILREYIFYKIPVSANAVQFSVLFRKKQPVHGCFFLVIFTNTLSYSHLIFLDKSTILFVKRRWHMERQELYEKALEEQEGRIREMERIISLLEEENSLQRQLIEGLKEENSVLEKQAQKYLETMRKMLEDIHQ